jgi:Bacterial EndoU nuclease
MEKDDSKFVKLCKKGVRYYRIIEYSNRDLYILAYFLNFEIWGQKSYTLYIDWLKSLPSKRIVGGNTCRLARTDDKVILYFEADARHYESYQDVPNLDYFSITPSNLVNIIGQWVKLAFANKLPCEIMITQKDDIISIEPTKGPVTFDLNSIFIVDAREDRYMIGFHADFEGRIEKARKILFSHHEEGPHGIYRAVVEYAGMKGEKTFFPKSWNPEKVITKIIEAIQTVDLSSYMNHGNDKIRFFAYTSEGIQLDILLDANSSEVSSAYPTYALWKHGDLLSKALGM